ncbi:hypothetical protein RJ639_014373 [Escallonia herrerae]|uniref:Sieve element occlusion C-terminal domain-containing protein n=1 Tax=Escallonia herrerae TaxID=1293975 RepID=A0AA88VFU6_9ASTE|nr:hypothetical protein RJ639_014373 [Escallonia herrerae]
MSPMDRILVNIGRQAVPFQTEEKKVRSRPLGAISIGKEVPQYTLALYDGTAETLSTIRWLSYMYTEETKQQEGYHLLARLIETPTTDYITVDLGELRKKKVLLLISDLDLSHREILILEQIFDKSRAEPTSPFEVVWFPSWYSVHPPSLLDSSVVIRYIKEVWHFNKRPMLVVLDSKGAVVHKNALPMIWIWRAKALPFSSLREVTLWQEEAWGADLIVKAIQPMVTSWIMVIIDAEKLSHMLPNVTSVWLFWVRPESMWLSKLRLGNRVEKDTMMQEIKTMLSLDMCYLGWVMFSRGSSEMVRAKGGIVLDILDELVQSKEPLEPTGFVPALQKHLRRIQTVRPIGEELMACQGCGREIDELVRQKP